MKETNGIENLLRDLEKTRESFDEVSKQEKQLRERESEILSKVLERIAPLSKHIGEKVRTYYHHPGGQFVQATTEYTDQKGIHLFSLYKEEGEYTLSGSEAPFRPKTSDQNRGTVDGISHYLMEDGKIYRLKWAGDWSAWQNESTTEEAIKIEKIGTDEIVEHIGLEEVMKQLSKKFGKAEKENDNKRKYLGKRKKLVSVIEDILDL